MELLRAAASFPGRGSGRRQFAGTFESRSIKTESRSIKTYPRFLPVRDWDVTAGSIRRESPSRVVRYELRKGGMHSFPGDSVL
jgi:hypothetical protein